MARVFVSYRAVDRKRVEPFVTWLRDQGIDAFLDSYEILPGDPVVDTLETAMADASVGLVMLSRGGVGETWTRWELSVLMTRRIEGGCRLIPVMLDPDAPVPVGLQHLRRASIDDRDDILAALSPRPSAGPASVRIDSAPGSWIDRVPFDVSVPEAQELLRLLSAVVGNIRVAVYLAEVSGIDPAFLDTHGSPFDVWRGILSAAVKGGKLRALVGHVRADRNYAGIHDRLDLLVPPA